MAEGSESRWQVVVSSTPVSCPGIFPLLDGLRWSPEMGNLDLQIKVFMKYTMTEIKYKYWLLFTNVTKFVESAGTEPLRDHPPAALWFSVSQGHTDSGLLPGLVLNPKGHCDGNIIRGGRQRITE